MTHYDTTFRRLATATSFAGLFSYAAVLFTTPSANNQIQDYYHVSFAQLGLLPFALMSGFFVAVLYAGTYSDKHGKLPAIFAGCTTMALGTTTFALADSYPVVVFAQLLMGIGGGLSEGTSMALISDLYAGSRKTSMMNLSQAAFGAGAVSLPIAMGLLINAGISWRFGYASAAVCAATTAIMTSIAILMRKERPHREHHTPGAWRKIITNRKMILWTAGIFLYVGAEIGQSNWMSVYLKHDLLATEAMAAISVSLMWAGITAGRMTIAAWATRFMSELTIVRLSIAGAAVCQAALLLIGHPVTALVISFFLGFFLGPFFPTITSMAGTTYPRQSGVVLGIIVACGSAGAAIFTPTIGIIADSLGIRGALWTCFGVLAINLMVFLALYRENGSRVCIRDL